VLVLFEVTANYLFSQ